MDDGEKRSEYTNTSRLIHKGPLKICCVMLAGDGEAVNCQVYDGASANDELKAHIEAIQSTTFGWGPRLDVKFHKGLYIAVSGSGAKVTVTFEPLTRKAVERR